MEEGTCGYGVHQTPSLSRSWHQLELKSNLTMRRWQLGNSVAASTRSGCATVTVSGKRTGGASGSPRIRAIDLYFKWWKWQCSSAYTVRTNFHHARCDVFVS